MFRSRLATALAVASIITILAAASPGTFVQAQESATLSVDPPSQTIGAGSTFSIAIKQNVGVATTGAQADLVFDPSLLQVISVELGKGYAGAAFLVGRNVCDGNLLEGANCTAQTLDQAISEANTSGTIRNMTTFFSPGSGSVQSGENEFVFITFSAASGTSGTSPLTISGPQEVLDDEYSVLPVISSGGSVTIDPAGPVTQATSEGVAIGDNEIPTPDGSGVNNGVDTPVSTVLGATAPEGKTPAPAAPAASGNNTGSGTNGARASSTSSGGGGGNVMRTIVIGLVVVVTACAGPLYFLRRQERF